MSQTTFISQFGVYQTCRDLDAQVKLYTEYGFVIDKGFTATEGMFDPQGVKNSKTDTNVAKKSHLSTMWLEVYQHRTWSRQKLSSYQPTHTCM